MATQDAILRLILDTQGVLKNLSVLVREWLQASSRMDRASNDIDFQQAKRETESLRALVDKSAAAITVNLQRIDTEAKKAGGGFGATEKAVVRLKQTAEREIDKIARAAQRIEFNKARKEAKEAEAAISKLTKTADTELKKVEKSADRISLKRARDEAKAAENAIKVLERAAATSFKAMEQKAQATGAQLRVGIGGNLTRLSPQVQDLQRKFQAALQAMRTSADRVSFENARREAERLQQAIHRMGQAAATDLAKVNQDARKAASGVANLRGVADQLRNVMASLGVVISARSILQLGLDATQTAIRVEALEAQLKAAGGTQERFTELLRFTHDQAERLGFDYEVIAQSTARFEAASRLAGISEAERLNIIRSVIEASRVLQLSNQRISNTLLALEQIASKGTVSMEELRRQLGDNLPGAVQILANELGVTTEQLIKMIEQNKVLSSEALPALARGFDKAFGPGLQVALQTTATGIGRVQKELLDLKVAFVEGFEAELKEAIKNVESDLEGMPDVARAAGELTLKVLKKLKEEVLPAGLIEFIRQLTVVMSESEPGAERYASALILIGQRMAATNLEAIKLAGTAEDIRAHNELLSTSYGTLTRDMVDHDSVTDSLNKRMAGLVKTEEGLEAGKKRLTKEIKEQRKENLLLWISTGEMSERERELREQLEQVEKWLVEVKQEQRELTGAVDEGKKGIKGLREELKAHREELEKSAGATDDRRTAEERLNDALAEGFELQRQAREEVFGTRKELEDQTQTLLDAVQPIRQYGEEVKIISAALESLGDTTVGQFDLLQNVGNVTAEQVSKVREEIQELLDSYAELGEVVPESLQLLAQEFNVTTSIVEKELKAQEKALEKAAEEQKKHLEEIRKSVKSVADEFIKLSETLEGESGATEVEKLQKKLKELSQEEFDLGVGEGEEFEKIRQQIEETREELQKAKEAQEEVGQAGSDMAEQIDEAIRSMVEKIGPAFGDLEFSGQQAIEAILQRLQNLGQLGEVTSDELARSVRQIITEFESAGLPVDDLRTALSELQTGVFDIRGAFETLRKEAGENEDSLEGIRRKTEEIQAEHKKLAESVSKMKGLWKELADTAEQELPRAATAYDALLTRQERSIELCQALKQCMSGVL